MAFYRDQIWKLDEYHEMECLMMLMWEFVRHINKNSYVLITVGSEPCPYMARISHDPPRSNYVAILKIEDKSHACGRTLQNQAGISTITIAFTHPKNGYQVSFFSLPITSGLSSIWLCIIM